MDTRYEIPSSTLFDLTQSIVANDNVRIEYQVEKNNESGFNERIDFIPRFIHSSLFETFIVATSESGLFLIDQHTAHERIQYEKFKDLLDRENQISQALLEPVAVLLTRSEHDILSKYPEVFSSLGFDFEDFGPAGIKINTVPSYLAKGQEEEAVKTIIDLISNDLPVQKSQLFDKMAKSLSCRSAVKKGESVSLYDYTILVEKLYKCKEPLRCPHGRPTVIYFSKDDIFKLFNRAPQSNRK
jgi:DNA mismatch repair protein MutL